MIYCVAEFDGRLVIATAFSILGSEEYDPRPDYEPVEAPDWKEAKAHFLPLLKENGDA
jgi:hypothetical protein